MLKQLKKSFSYNLNKFSLIGSSNNLSSLQKYYFSGGHHSGSDSEHDHHHSSTSATDVSESEDPLTLQRNRIFRAKPEKFCVDSLLDSLKSPVDKKQERIDESSLSLFKTKDEYIIFLASNFEKHALKRYPEYKIHLNEFKDRIYSFDKLNAYQKEVMILDTYMMWRLEKLREETVNVFESNYSHPLDQLKNRFELLSKLTKSEGNHDHHHGDRIANQLKEKLNEVIKKELEFEEFKNSYNKEMESNLISKVIEKKNIFYQIQENKVETNKKLNTLTSPLNNKKPIYDATIDEHIHPQHWLHNPHQAMRDRFKYMAYFDLILDNHMRQVRPKNVYDDPFLYVKPQHRPLYYSEDDFMNNMYFDYYFSLDNELYQAFKRDTDLMFEGKIDQIKDVDPNPSIGNDHDQHGHGAPSVTHHNVDNHDDHHAVKHEEVNPDEDQNRPCLKLWKDKFKFPHVADRLGWDFLGEYPLDKNPMFENVYSHPAYQWQPFVQTPPLNPHEDLNFEQGETVYENRWVLDWVRFWRIIALMAPIPLIAFIYESYNQQTVPSPEYMSRFAMLILNNNMGHRGTDRPLMEKVKFWGKDMWMWQHWIRKSLYYVLVMASLIYFEKAFRRLGCEYVTKMVYNRQKDLVFVWRTTGYFRPKMQVFELHYLEQMCPSLVNGWEHLGQFKEDGIVTVLDMRSGGINLAFYNDKKYWNIDQREHFFHNTTNFWRGLRSKHVDGGLIINNDNSLDPSEADQFKKTQQEIKSAIEKFGPLMANDYNYHYKYHFFKNIYEQKNKLIKESLAL